MKSKTASLRRRRFLKVAVARTNKLLTAIRILSNCSNRAAYCYEASEVREIFEAIDSELRKCRVLFENGKAATDFKFLTPPAAAAGRGEVG